MKSKFVEGGINMDENKELTLVEKVEQEAKECFDDSAVRS